MQKVHGSSQPQGIFKIYVLLVGFLLVSLPALAQNSSSTTMSGTVVSANRDTMVVRVEGNQYRLFVFDKATVKPATIAPGSLVRVISTQTDDTEVRLASLVTLAQAPAPAPAAAPTPAEPDIVPESIRDAENAIMKDIRKFHVGFQGGIAMDPELLDVGVHARFGPFFSRNVQFRPSIDFGFGEITKIFSINADVIYNLKANRGDRRTIYFGGGPQFNFVSQSLTNRDVDFSDFHYSTGLNVLLGMRLRNGLFTEMKTSIYARPAPVFRLLVGYTF